MTFEGMLNSFVTVYLDDIIVFSANKQEHLVHLIQVFECLRQKQFYCKLPKCKVSQSEIQYLGLLITNGTIANRSIKRVILYIIDSCFGCGYIYLYAVRVQLLVQCLHNTVQHSIVLHCAHPTVPVDIWERCNSVSWDNSTLGLVI